MKLCALVVGHKESSPGAVNEVLQMSEFSFNSKLSLGIQEALTGADIAVLRVFRKTYRQLPDDINGMNPDFIISMHCNAYDRKASGTEVLYYHRSIQGYRMARVLQAELVACLGLRNRGIIPCNIEDRGGYLLCHTKAPCIIAEPFFIDNSDDLKLALSKYDQLVEAYKSAVLEIAKITAP